jgi:hypothetical protein
LQTNIIDDGCVLRRNDIDASFLKSRGGAHGCKSPSITPITAVRKSDPNGKIVKTVIS